jgi:hypothetical protein
MTLRNQGWNWQECGNRLQEWARHRAWVGIYAEEPPKWDDVDWIWLAHELGS